MGEENPLNLDWPFGDHRFVPLQKEVPAEGRTPASENTGQHADDSALD